VKHILIIFSIFLLQGCFPKQSPEVYVPSGEKCYVVVESTMEFDLSLLSNISISLISKYLRKVEHIPVSGISTDSCQYQISVSKNNDTTFVTFKGEGLNSYGDSKLTGSDGFQQSILKSLYRSLKDKRNLICQDYGTLLEECGKTIVSYREKGILFDIGVDEWKWIVNGDEKTDGKYEGEIKNGKPDGQGINTSPDGTNYVGEFKDGRPDGLGITTFHDGEKYEGEFKDGLPNGKGTETYSSGNKYVGEFKDGKKHGQGKFTIEGGPKVEGEFKDDKFWNGTYYDKNGNIKYKYVNGVKLFGDNHKGKILYRWKTSSGNGYVWIELGDKDIHPVYKGQVENGKPHGLGLIRFTDGGKYEGEYKNGKKDGQGTYTFTSGSKYEGGWKDGKPNGQGSYTWSDGRKYVGEHKDGEPNGQGTETYSSGNKYVGEFKDGKKHGQGTETLPSGQKYVGSWKDGRRNGQGKLNLPDGETYVGEYKDDEEWNGTLYEKDGNIFEKVVNGTPIKQ
jgi:hypothetical protein